MDRSGGLASPFCLVRFHGMLTQMIRGAWLAHVCKLNGAVLGTTVDLEEFLSGRRRGDLSVRCSLNFRRVVCFYCHRDLARVETFIISCHGRGTQWTWATTSSWRIRHAMVPKGSMLPAEEHPGCWVERNCAYSPLIAEACERPAPHDLRYRSRLRPGRTSRLSLGGSIVARGRVPRSDNG